MFRFLAAVVLTAASAAIASPCRAEPRSEWNFVVRLDGQRIGTHRFVVERQAGGAAQVASDAHFAVRLLGWTAYRYDHHARERWSGSCLARLDATTDDDGHVARVHESFDAGRCVMSFAYWNAALRSQRQLLDPGTGRLVDVTITPLAPAPVETGDGMVNAPGWRIAGLPNPIEIRWDDDGWVALDTTVSGGRHLTYRLQ